LRYLMLQFIKRSRKSCAFHKATNLERERNRRLSRLLEPPSDERVPAYYPNPKLCSYALINQMQTPPHEVQDQIIKKSHIETAIIVDSLNLT
jgi:hypothetical protein